MATLAKADPRKWARLADSLRAEIPEGTLAPGHPVRSITALAQLGYARQTCAKALRALEREGILTRYPSVGYYVTRPARDR